MLDVNKTVYVRSLTYFLGDDPYNFFQFATFIKIN